MPTALKGAAIPGRGGGATRLTIGRLSERGEGVAEGPEGVVFIPYALPGDIILAEVENGRGTLVEIVQPGPSRIPPHCPYFTRCGGCAVQALEADAYAAWKRDLVAAALRRAGVPAEVAGLVDAHGEGRRRATFHARFPGGRPAAGFMRARAHDIVEIDACPLLAPSMAGALPLARALTQALAGSGKPLDILVTATAAGMDADVRGHRPLGDSQRKAIIRAGLKHDPARLTNHGETVLMLREPVLRIGKAAVVLPPGAFLQATEAGEIALGERVCAYAAGAKRAADLFSGVGTFALRLAEFAAVEAFDQDEAALSAQARAARTAALRPVKVAQRDLFRRPLTPAELEPYDAVVFDPPRAGAEAQSRALAASAVPVIAAVACNAQTFARDAAILCSGGYELSCVEPIDQFRHSSHVEIAACFRRAQPSRRKRRPLLG